MSERDARGPEELERATGVARPQQIEVVPATFEHAKLIRLRAGDLMEIRALGGTQEQAFAISLGRSLWAETWLIDGEPAAIRGLIQPSLLDPRVASPWMMTGEPVERHRKLFLRETRRGIERLRDDWDLLVTFVHPDYRRAVRWLQWLGFTIGPLRPVGRLNTPFHQATLRGRS